MERTEIPSGVYNIAYLEDDLKHTPPPYDDRELWITLYEDGKRLGYIRREHLVIRP